MYLTFLVAFVLIHSIQSDCGCGNTNRESKCEENDPLHKYVQENNIPTKESNNDNMVLIQGNTFLMGTNEPYFESDFEGPAKNVSVKSFYMDKYEVSNKDFNEFIKDTGYETEAEVFGDSFIFELLVDEKERENYKEYRAVAAPWWIKMKGVSWKHPEGEKSNIDGIVKLFLCIFIYELGIF